MTDADRPSDGNAVVDPTLFVPEVPAPRSAPPQPDGHSERQPPPPPPPPQEFIAADIKRQTVRRLEKSIGLLADQAWTSRRRDPIAPHAVLYHFGVPDRERAPGWYRLRSAMRVDPLSEELLDPAAFVKGLALALYKKFHLGSVDVRDEDEICTYSEPMRKDATYIGVSLVTLVTPTQSWEHVLATATNALHIAGRSITTFIDGTHLLIDRGPAHILEQRFIYTDAPLEYGPEHTFRWYWLSALPAAAVPSTEIRYWLDELHRLATTAAQHPKRNTHHDDDMHSATT
jgi:hypothetical protein